MEQGDNYLNTQVFNKNPRTQFPEHYLFVLFLVHKKLQYLSPCPTKTEFFRDHFPFLSLPPLRRLSNTKRERPPTLHKTVYLGIMNLHSIQKPKKAGLPLLSLSIPVSPLDASRLATGGDTTKPKDTGTSRGFTPTDLVTVSSPDSTSGGKPAEIKKIGPSLLAQSSSHGDSTPTTDIFQPPRLPQR